MPQHTKTHLLELYSHQTYLFQFFNALLNDIHSHNTAILRSINKKFRVLNIAVDGKEEVNRRKFVNERRAETRRVFKEFKEEVVGVEKEMDQEERASASIRRDHEKLSRANSRLQTDYESNVRSSTERLAISPLTIADVSLSLSNSSCESPDLSEISRDGFILMTPPPVKSRNRNRKVLAKVTLRDANSDRAKSRIPGISKYRRVQVRKLNLEEW